MPNTSFEHKPKTKKPNYYQEPQLPEHHCLQPPTPHHTSKSTHCSVLAISHNHLRLTTHLSPNRTSPSPQLLLHPWPSSMNLPPPCMSHPFTANPQHHCHVTALLEVVPLCTQSWLSSHLSLLVFNPSRTAPSLSLTTLITFGKYYLYHYFVKTPYWHSTHPLLDGMQLN